MLWSYIVSYTAPHDKAPVGLTGIIEKLCRLLYTLIFSTPYPCLSHMCQARVYSYMDKIPLYGIIYGIIYIMYDITLWYNHNSCDSTLINLNMTRNDKIIPKTLSGKTMKHEGVPMNVKVWIMSHGLLCCCTSAIRGP